MCFVMKIFHHSNRRKNKAQTIFPQFAFCDMKYKWTLVPESILKFRLPNAKPFFKLEG
jgi:hypothetical protein